MAPFFILDNFLTFLKDEKRFSSHTIVAYQNDLSQFFEFTSISSFADLEELNHQLVRGWIVDLINQNYVAKTVNRKISSLRSFIKWCEKNGFIHHNPVKKIVAPKIPKRLPQFVKESEMKKGDIEPFCSNDFESVRNELIVEVLYQTGIRLSELVNLKIQNLSTDSIKVLGKRNKERIIPISNDLKILFDTYLSIRNEVEPTHEYLFILKCGKKIYDKLVYRIINNYLSFQANLDKKSPHVLRHSFATHMMNNGAGLEVLKELLGHANLSATQVYTHNSFSQMSSIYSQAHPRGQKK
jgi:integrase/recombinase XerC